jgi:hypothetical protein
MGLFGDSQQEKELKELMVKASETMRKLVDEMNEKQSVTSYARTCINQLGSEVNMLYEKSANLSSMKQMSMQVTIDGQSVPFANGKIGLVMFIKDFERRTGEKFNLKYN